MTGGRLLLGLTVLGCVYLRVDPLLVYWWLPPISPSLESVGSSLPSLQIKFLSLLLYTFKYSNLLSSNLTYSLFRTCFSLSFCDLLLWP